MGWFVSIFHLYHFFGIICKSIFHNLNITLSYWFISKTINIWFEVTLSENAPWVPGITEVWHGFSFFIVMATFQVTSYIFVLKYFKLFYSWVPNNRPPPPPQLVIFRFFFTKDIFIPIEESRKIEESHLLFHS